MKGTLKRVMSGVLSVITIASAVAQPITAYAAEPEKAASSFEAQYPELETVKDKLAEDEILIANDYSIDYGSDFDIKVDFSGIEGINDAKVKVELYEAKNEAGDDFDTYQADTYGKECGQLRKCSCYFHIRNTESQCLPPFGRCLKPPGYQDL